MKDNPHREDGLRLKAIYQRRKADWGLTQEKMCSDLNINQGLLHNMFIGARPIPFERLLDMAIYLDVSPDEIVPKAADMYKKYTKAMRQVQTDELLDGLPDADRKTVVEYVAFLKARSSAE